MLLNFSFNRSRVRPQSVQGLTGRAGGRGFDSRGAGPVLSVLK